MFPVSDGMSSVRKWSRIGVIQWSSFCYVFLVHICLLNTYVVMLDRLGFSS